MLLDQMLNLKRRHPHFHPEVFHFLAPADDTSVIIREHRYWLADQVGPKYPFTRHVKIVCVNQTDQSAIGSHPLKL